MFFETYDEAEDFGIKSGKSFRVHQHPDNRRNCYEVIWK